MNIIICNNMGLQMHNLSPAKIFLLWSTVFLTFLIGFTSNQTTTKSPGVSLQAALDQLKFDLAKVRDDVSKINPNRIAKIEKDISAMNATMNQHLIDFDYYIGDLYKRYNNFSARLGTLEKKVGDIDRSLSSLTTKVNGIEAKIDGVASDLEEFKGDTDGKFNKLHNVNQIWKSNFKIVNQTFIALRKKITFNVVRLGQPPPSRKKIG